MKSPGQSIEPSVQTSDISAFEELYKQYYVYLCLVAVHIVRNSSDAEEIVSDVFVKLWNMGDKIGTIKSLKAYLIKAVQNTALNYLEKTRRSSGMTDSLDEQAYKVLAWDSDYPLGQLYEKELLEKLRRGIKDLPDSCREIFLLSRDKEMKYEEISEKLGISVNTVKSQMKIALSRLRDIVLKYMH